MKTRTPLREFVAGNLFDDLLTPEVEVAVPTGRSDGDFENELLPAIRTLREMMPGNVTRHFGVSSFSRRHWVPLDLDTGDTMLDVVDHYSANFVCEFGNAVGKQHPRYRPTEIPSRSRRERSATEPR